MNALNGMSVTKPFAALLLSSLLASPSTFAAEGESSATNHSLLSVAGVPITGRVFSDLYLPAADPTSGNITDSSFRQASTSLWLQGDPKFGEHSSAHFILTADALEANNIVLGSGPQSRVGLREGYVSYFNAGWEFRLGRQILPWGKVDVISPTDLLSAKDYTFFNPDDEVRRIGATSLWINWVPQGGNAPFNFTGVITPVFPQTRLLIPPTSVPAGISVNATPQSPEQTLANTEAALKATYTGNSWDASLLLFRGFNHKPEFFVQSFNLDSGTGALTSAIVGQTFHHFYAIGSDGSFTSGNWIFRGETAYVWTENNSGANPLIIPTYWDTALGVERPVGRDFRIQLQGLLRYIPRFQDPSNTPGATPVLAALNSQVASINALLLSYQFQTRPTGTLRIAYSNENSNLDAEFFGMLNIVGGDYFLLPQFSYRWTEALKTTAGINFYGGPSNRPLGALRAYNSVFLEGKYTF